MSFLNYEPDILERIDTLGRSQDLRKKIFEEVSQILLDRAKLEEFYARSLERLCEGLQKIKINNNDCIKQIVQIIITLFSSQAEQSQTFGSSIINEIIPGFKDIFKDDQHSLKNMQKIGERHEKDLIRQVQGFDKIRKQYVHMSQVVEKKAKEQNAIKIQLDQQLKLNEKSQDMNIINQLKKKKQDFMTEQKVLECMNRQKQNSEHELQQYIQKYNRYIDEYFLDVARAEDRIQNQEIAKREQLKDSIMKYLVFKVSQVRNLQYDVDRITNKLGEIDAKMNIKQYLNEMLNQSKDIRHTNQNKPLLCKLNFDNYKQFIDTKFQDSLNKDQSQEQQQLQRKISQPVLTNQSEETKIRPKIFSQQNNLPAPPVLSNNNNNIPRIQSEQDQNTAQRKMKIFQTSNMFIPRKTSNEFQENKNTQQENNIQQKLDGLQQQEQQQYQKQQQQQQQQQQLQVTEEEPKLIQESQIVQDSQSNQQQEQENNKRVVLLKTDSNHIKQPKEYKFIDIMALIKEKQEQICLKKIKEQQRQTSNNNEISNENNEDIIEIEKEDLFEYILLKIWHNNELQSYDIDQLKQIIERDSDSRESFANYFCNFFQQIIKDKTQKLLSEEKDMMNILILEKGRADITIEINSDTYTYLMRVLYCVLDVLNSSNDIHFISDIFRTSKAIFKVIRPPDEDIKSFECIFLHQGLSGHQLFQNTNHWQNKLQTIIEQIENQYEQRVRNLSSVSDNDEVQINKILSNPEIKDSEMNSELGDEGVFIYQKLLVSIKDLFEFNIPKDSIIQIIKNLFEDAILASEISKYLIKYVEQYERKEVAIMQSEEISVENNSLKEIQNLNNDQAEEIKDYSSSSSSFSDDLNQYKKNSSNTKIDNQEYQINIGNSQTMEEGKQENNDSDFDDDNDNQQDMNNKYIEGLS